MSRDCDCTGFRSAQERLNEPLEKRQKLQNSDERVEDVAGEESCAYVPQLPGCQITYSDLDTAVRVLEAVTKLTKDREHGLTNYQHKALRPLRKALAKCMELQTQLMYNGKPEYQHFKERQEMRSLKRQKKAESDHQKKYIANTQLRRGRIEKLRQLQDDAEDEERSKLLMLVPDGHVETMTLGSSDTKLLENGGEEDVNGEEKKITNDNSADARKSGEVEEPLKLPKLRSCYVCKKRYRVLHHFYDQLCETCAPLNWEKRHLTADLSGKVAIVTGSRVKIGYQTCLKLLRAGCLVVATTRFPNAAADTYKREADFSEWKHRLQIYGLDLRDVTGIEAFTRFLKQSFPNGIDILINNACQTIRRPRGYYIPVVEKEEQLWREADEAHKSLLVGCVEFERIRRRLVRNNTNNNARLAADPNARNTPMLPAAADDEDANCTNQTAASLKAAESESDMAIVLSGDEQDRAPFEMTGISHSAAMSQMILLPEDVGVSEKVLPPGLSDINGQQLDLRTTNSWLLKMEEVSTPEIMECMFINAIAPFVLNSRLKPLLAYPADESRPDRFIVNVSAMEAKFYRYKMPNHPHTNMAKAALNMMTRTSSEDLAINHRIYMNSVDTGWINDENPLERASKIAKTNLFQTPIDEIDAAARILDPVFSGVNGQKKEYGKFLKDYRETEW